MRKKAPSTDSPVPLALRYWGGLADKQIARRLGIIYHILKKKLTACMLNSRSEVVMKHAACVTTFAPWRGANRRMACPSEGRRGLNGAGSDNYGITGSFSFRWTGVIGTCEPPDRYPA